MANYMLKAGEKARIVWVIVWLEDIERLYSDKDPYAVILDYMQSLHQPCAVSPVHDKDTYSVEDVRNWTRRHIDPDTGEVKEECRDTMPVVGQPKKAHVHIYLEFKNPVGPDYLSKHMKDLLPIKENRWERVIYPDSAKRYLAHMDEQESGKYRYACTDIHSFGGVKMDCLLREDDFIKVNTLIACQSYIEDNHVRHYHVLARWAFSTGDYMIIACVTGRAAYFANFFRSMSDEKRERAERDKLARENADKS